MVLTYTKCQINIHAPRLVVRNQKHIFKYSTQTYVVGTQKSRPDETVLWSTQNMC